jgi:CRP-like cAMP-binding protein
MRTPTLEPLVRKLDGRGELSGADRDALMGLPFTARTVPPASYVVREGEPPRTCPVLLSGFAFRHKLVGDGGRQIVSLHMPGDALDFQALHLSQTDHNVQTLTQAELAMVPMAAIQALVAERPAVAKAVVLDMLIEASILREWVTNIGRRDARTRLAHLLCEFACRMDTRQLDGTGEYEVPMTQEQIGDALGLTSVHVNRSIKALEADGLIRRHKRTLVIPDIRALRDVADFSDLYLHLDQRG